MSTVETLEQARGLLAQGDWAAVEALCRPIAFDPVHAAAAQQFLGIALLERGGASDEAVSWLESAQQLAPDAPETHANLARAHLRRQRFAPALAAAQRAVKLAGSVPEWRLLLAEIQFQLGRFAEARSHLKVARGLDGDNSRILALLGQAENASGRFGEAEEALSHLPLPSGKIEKAQIGLYPLVRHLADARHNGQLKGGPRVLAVRHPRVVPDGYQVLVDWIRVNRPEYDHLFELRLLPFELEDPERYGVIHPWLQDPVQDWSRQTYDQAVRIGRALEARGVTHINPVDRLVHASKSRAPEFLERVGLRMARSVLIADPDRFRMDAAGLAYPFMIREDWGHGGDPIRIENADELAYAPLENFRRPVATEIIDVSNEDGRYRKFRYIACGRWGVSHHLMLTPMWVTRGGDRIYDEAARQEELAYIGKPDPHHEKFQAAREALGLNFLSYDYGYDRSGTLYVWEANPFAYIHFPYSDGRSGFRNAAIHRTMAGMLAMYLDALELPVPEDIQLILDVDNPASDEAIDELVNPRGNRPQ
ncbi:MAG: tetratricopeptide repeat protein [Pseudomonadota bacterium]